jgi:hypothetical protein
MHQRHTARMDHTDSARPNGRAPRRNRSIEPIEEAPKKAIMCLGTHSAPQRLSCFVYKLATVEVMSESCQQLRPMDSTLGGAGD